MVDTKRRPTKRVITSENQPAAPSRPPTPSTPQTLRAQIAALPPPNSGAWEPILPRAPSSAVKDIESADVETIRARMAIVEAARKSPSEIASTAGRGSGWSFRTLMCPICEQYMDTMTAMEVVPLHWNEHHDVYMRGPIRRNHPNAEIYEWQDGDDELVEQMLRLSVGDNGHDVERTAPAGSPPATVRSAGTRPSTYANGGGDVPQEAHVQEPERGRGPQVPPLTPSSRTSSPPRTPSLPSGRGSTYLGSPQAIHSTPPATSTPAAPACLACRMLQNPEQHAVDSTRLQAIALGKSRVLRDRLGKEACRPWLPTALAFLALPAHDEADLLTLLRAHAKDELYGAMSGAGYCFEHVIDVLHAVRKDTQQGYGLVGVQ